MGGMMLLVGIGFLVLTVRLLAPATSTARARSPRAVPAAG
jgi:hypothetical protein